MFLSDTHLPQLLPADCYRSQQWHDAEWSSVMMPAWQCVGTTQEFPGEGSFRTTRLLDRPLITWKIDGTYSTFLNICPHRFATLTDQPSGQCNRLVCRYHGWEFDHHGDTRKIPDARNFKPLQKGKLGLTRFATEVVGNLVLVNLSPSPQSIDDFLGENRAYVEEFYGGPRELLFSEDQIHEANWKLVVENSLESYHVTMVHANTFGTTAETEACTHLMGDRWNKFVEDTTFKNSSTDRLGRRMLDFIKYPHSREYQHLLLYPNGMLTSMPPFSLVHWTTPLSPTRAISRWRVMGFANREPTTRQRLAAPLFRRYAKRFFPMLLEEDRVVQEAVQQGLNSPQLARGGLISAREERIHHFQQMIADAVDLDLPLQDERRP